MLDYWMIPRPKRTLISVPEVLAVVAETSVGGEWSGQRGVQLSVEDALESAGLKRIGDRRDGGASGARTYKSWLKSLGLVFEQSNSNILRLTLAGNAILDGEPPVPILKSQLMKFQYPSSYSIGRGVEISSRFKVHPFVVLLKLIADERLGYLTQEEIEKIVIHKGENDSQACYENLVNFIIDFRNGGTLGVDQVVEDECNSSTKYSDIANSFINWLDYTQLIDRHKGSTNGSMQGHITVIPEKAGEVSTIIGEHHTFIEREDQEEYFQRKFGVDLNHEKDTRNFLMTSAITIDRIARTRVQRAFMTEASQKPIFKIDSELINSIADSTGLEYRFVEDTLEEIYPNGAVSQFLTEYYHMAFSGRDKAIEFEEATTNLFEESFGFETRHIGQFGKTPDVLLISDSEGYSAIIDNKAYSEYSIDNDHRNRMIVNYINGIHNYYNGHPLAFFTYIAGGFCSSIDSQISGLAMNANVNGSAITVSDTIQMIENNASRHYTHSKIRDIFSVNRRIRKSDL